MCGVGVWQVWLSDFLAKEKQVAGVKDEPKEAEDAAPAPAEATAAAASSEGKAFFSLLTHVAKAFIHSAMCYSPQACAQWK